MVTAGGGSEVELKGDESSLLWLLHQLEGNVEVTEETEGQLNDVKDKVHRLIASRLAARHVMMDAQLRSVRWNNWNAPSYEHPKLGRTDQRLTERFKASRVVHDFGRTLTFGREFAQYLIREVSGRGPFAVEGELKSQFEENGVFAGCVAVIGRELFHSLGYEVGTLDRTKLEDNGERVVVPRGAKFLSALEAVTATVFQHFFVAVYYVTCCRFRAWAKRIVSTLFGLKSDDEEGTVDRIVDDTFDPLGKVTGWGLSVSDGRGLLTKFQEAENRQRTALSVCREIREELKEHVVGESVTRSFGRLRTPLARHLLKALEVDEAWKNNIGNFDDVEFVEEVFDAFCSMLANTSILDGWSSETLRNNLVDPRGSLSTNRFLHRNYGHGVKYLSILVEKAVMDCGFLLLRGTCGVGSDIPGTPLNSAAIACYRAARKDSQINQKCSLTSAEVIGFHTVAYALTRGKNAGEGVVEGGTFSFPMTHLVAPLGRETVKRMTECVISSGRAEDASVPCAYYPVPGDADRRLVPSEGIVEGYYRRFPKFEAISENELRHLGKIGVCVATLPSISDGHLEFLYHSHLETAFKLCKVNRKGAIYAPLYPFWAFVDRDRGNCDDVYIESQLGPVAFLAIKIKGRRGMKSGEYAKSVIRDSGEVFGREGYR